jgi:hypothetical protein
VYELHNTGALVNYLHKALFSPKKSALLHAVKQGNLITWPGLTEEAIHKHLKMTPATAMGHINQKRQNIRSTSKIVEVTSDLEDVSVTPVGTGEKTNLVYAVVIDQGHLYTDLTGRFPVRSSKGNWYIMIVYSYDCNYISGRCRTVGGSTGVGFNSLCLPWVFTTVVLTIVAFPTHPQYGWLQVLKPHFPIESKYGVIAPRSAIKIQ